MYQQLWGYKVEVKLYLGVRDQKRLNTTDLGHTARAFSALFLDTRNIGLSSGQPTADHAQTLTQTIQ